MHDFIATVEKKIAVVPRFKLKDRCHLVAMVIRDVDRLAQQWKAEEQQQNYEESFLG